VQSGHEGFLIRGDLNPIYALGSKMFSLSCFDILLSLLPLSFSKPTQQPFISNSRYFDVQGHRGGRGEVVESTLPAFAWGLILGATTLELDNGITKDGVVVVWHDHGIKAEKCVDTKPAIENDSDFPYVGKDIVNLTLAQIKTLDCGSKRSTNFPLQLTYPGTKIPTLREVFEFAECADPEHRISWNIESKIDPIFPNKTQGVVDFVRAQHKEFVNSSYSLSQITYQSFDWRTLIAMKELDQRVITSALIDSETIISTDNSTSKWLAGLRIENFPGANLGEKISNAAASIGAGILSPDARMSIETGLDPSDPSYIPLSTMKDMIQRSHYLGMEVKPWTVNQLNIAEQLIDWGVDGIITDYPGIMRRDMQKKGKCVAPKYPKRRVLECLNSHISKQ